jgi:hypothetical protein
LDFYENEKNIFSEPHRQKYWDEIYDSSLPSQCINYGHQGFLTNEALQELQAQLLQI